MHLIGFNVCVDHSVDLRLCYQNERSNSFFSYFYNIRDAFKIEGMFKVFNFFGMGAVFGTNQNIRSFQNSLERR